MNLSLLIYTTDKLTYFIYGLICSTDKLIFSYLHVGRQQSWHARNTAQHLFFSKTGETLTYLFELLKKYKLISVFF